MSHENSLFSSSTNYSFLSLHATHNQQHVFNIRGELGTDLPALDDFIISSNGKVLLSANFDSSSKQSVIVVETFTNGSDFRLTQLPISHVYE